MKKESVIAIGAALVGVFSLSFSVTERAQAQAIHFNRAPKVLKGGWETNDRKLKVHSDPRIHYVVTSLYVANKEFHLEDFTMDKHKENLFNSGPYGSFARKHHKLAFRKISNRHYVITGDYSAMSGEYKSGYQVYLSKNRRSVKVYRYAKIKRPGYVKGHRYTVGNFHKLKVRPTAER